MRNSNSPAFAALGSLEIGLRFSWAKAEEVRSAIDISAPTLKIKVEFSAEESEDVLSRTSSASASLVSQSGLVKVVGMRG